MTFCGGSTEEGGFDIAGKGRGVDIWERIESLLPLSDFLKDFIGEDGGKLRHLKNGATPV